ncbi:MAG TPA: four helix bundle protein [Bacteroidales bacterium]|nr:four helix bundle protein [Bacteroidales bacterium]HPT03457.1 four helix bundle protein [Bacteroidales bacterium]
MFDFEKLEVYQLVKEQTSLVFSQLNEISGIEDTVLSTWKNSGLQIMLHLVQASGRVGTSEKKTLLTSARGYVFECAAILDLVKTSGLIEPDKYEELYNNYERISKMLLGMYKSYENKAE